MRYRRVRRMLAVDLLFNAALVCYLAGAIAGLASIWRPTAARFVVFSLALLRALLETVASGITIAQGAITQWNLPCGIDLFTWSVRLDPLSAFFSLALGILATAVSVFSFGYLRDWKNQVGVLGFFYNVLLLSLALVFTASNVFFFLI